MLHGGDFKTVKEFADWQMEQVRKDIQDGVVYSATEGVLSTVKDHKEELVTKGALTISTEGLTCGDFKAALSDISEIAMHGQRAIVFTAGKQYYELIPSEEANALRFYLYYMEWNNQKSMK